MPKCLYTGYAPSRLYGAQLMNDLKCEGAQWCDADKPLSFLQCQQFLEAVAHFHSKFWATTTLYDEIARQFPDNLTCGFQKGYHRAGPKDINRGVDMTRGRELPELLAARIDEPGPVIGR